MIRDAAARDFAQHLALNAASVHFLSPLDAVRLQRLHDQAAYHRVVELDGNVAAFLLALREGCDYDSPNYRWFADRYAQFLYIDRIVVDSRWQGHGLAPRLYTDLIEFAQSRGIAQLACEFDLQPPNPASAKLHARFGFREVGTQWLGGDKKRVSLQWCALGASTNRP